MKESPPPLERVQFPQGDPNMEVQPAVRTLHTCTQPYNAMFITCYQNPITAKRDMLRMNRWKLNPPVEVSARVRSEKRLESKLIITVM